MINVDDSIKYWTEEALKRESTPNISAVDLMIPYQWLYRLHILKIKELINQQTCQMENT